MVLDEAQAIGRILMQARLAGLAIAAWQADADGQR